MELFHRKFLSSFLLNNLIGLKFFSPKLNPNLINPNLTQKQTKNTPMNIPHFRFTLFDEVGFKKYDYSNDPRTY